MDNKITFTRKTEREKEVAKGVFIGLVIALFILSIASWAQSQEAKRSGIVIKVKPKIIVMPKGRIAKVSVKSARFRSDGLSELNKKYGAVSIEKLFELDDVKSTLPGKKKDLVSKDKAKISNNIDLEGLLTKEGREDMEKKASVKQIDDIYLLEFEGPGNMSGLLKEYSAVEEVLDVMAVERN